MSLSYFTIIHILVLCVIFALFVLFFILSLKASKKLFWSLVFTNVLVCSVISVFLMVVLDKYTKKGVLENLKNQRVLRTESIVFMGDIRNVGSFTLSNCNLSIKIVNNILSKDNLKGDNIFKSSGLSLFSWLSRESKENEKSNVIEYKFSVAKNLQAKKSTPFSASMPYPPYFSKAIIITKLNCY